MNFIRGLLFDNLGLKFVALLLAVLIYLNVYTDRPATMVVSFPLQLTDLPDSMSLSGSIPAAIQAELRGTGKQLIRMRLREPMLQISLANVRPGRFERSLTTSDLPLGGEGGPQVERLIGPLMLDIHIENKVTRAVPVAGRVEGVPADGHRWTGTLRFEPAAAQVTGPETAVTALDSLHLGVVSIAGARDTVDVMATPDDLPEWCDVAPPAVRVRVPIVPSTP